MEIALPILLFIVGIIFVVKGGDFFVDAASWIAEISGIPKLIVGATIVSVATTLPEMLVSIMAASQGKVDMSIGNAIGSVTANLGLIMAIALLCMPGVIKRKDYLLKSILMLFAALTIVICGFFGEVNMWFSLVLIAVFVVFICENVSSARKSILESRDKPNLNASDPDKAGKRVRPDKKTIIINVAKFLIGAAGIVFGADLLVNNGSELARLAGVSERIIGVTLVAVGTSLPELITTITAVVKKQSALSVGNILGANIMDLTLIMPLSTFISGKALPVTAASAMIDLPACLIIGLLAVIPAMLLAKFSRWQGAAVLAVYAVYIALTCAVI